MRVNTNINLRNRSRIELKNFKGLDTLSSPVEVSSIHGMECENLISRDGVNHKRYGWKTKLRIGNGKINAIFSFKLGGTSYVIAYVGGSGKPATAHNFYNVSSSYAVTKLTGSLNVNSWTDNCKCFVNGDKAYFIGFGDFLVYDGNTLKKVIDDNPYIPTTTENIGSEEKGQHYTRITAEERNLLSPYVYNTLFGAELENDEVLTYYLDAPNFIVKELIINDRKDVEVTVSESSSNYKRRVLSGYAITSELEGTFRWSNVKTTTIGVAPFGNTDDGKEVMQLVLPESITAIEFSNGYSIKLVFSYSDNMGVNAIEEYMGYVYCTPKIDVQIVFCDNEGTIVETFKDKDGKTRKFQVVPKYSLNLINGTLNVNWELGLQKATGKIITGRNTTDSGTFPNYENYIAHIKDKKIKAINKGIFKGVAEGCTILEKRVIPETPETTEITIVKDRGYYDINSGLLYLYLDNTITEEDRHDIYKPIVEGKPNIKVKLQSAEDKSAEVTTATNGCKFGLGGSDDRLFLTNDNVVMWSKDEDFTYFGEKSWCLCGTKETKIKDLDRLNDSTLLLVKEYSVREPSVYVISGLLNQGVTEGGTIDYTAIFTPKGYQVGMGAVGELTNFNGDCLMVCKDGVYSVSLGENMTVDARYIHHRSRQITNLLEKYDLSNAKCIACNGKYYLAIDGDCYVADNKYLTSFKGDMQNVPNYEWWKWTNMPVECWGYVNNDLCFGTTNGEICVFTDKFYDEELLGSTSIGSVSYKSNDKDEIIGFTTSKSVNLEGEIIKPNSSFYIKLETKNFEVEEGNTKLYLPLNEYNSLEYIYVGGLLKTLTKKDTYMELQGYVPEGDTIVFYKNMQDKILRVKKHETEDYYQFIYQDKVVYGDKVKTNGGLNLSQINFSMNTYKKTPIVAKWITGALDLGTRSHAKTLTKLIMTGEKDLANHLKYGIKTRVTNRNYEFLRANNDLDFENLDLETLSLDSQFASSFVKRLNLRNVNFIQLYLMSDTEEDMAINSIEVEYKIIKNNIGVN